MSWFLAFVGFAMLVVLHEAGHFAAAKAVGMRVERFSLFFPPLLLRKKIGETEYAIGAVPLGGYVKITGMSPDENLPDEVRTRAYTAQPVWKRIVVIAAGPLVNLVVAFLLLIAFFWQVGPRDEVVGPIAKGYPAAGVLQPGDRVISIDGRAGDPAELADVVARHRCGDQPPRKGCRAETPATVIVERDGERRTFELTPIYDPSPGIQRTRLGFQYVNDGPRETLAFGRSLDISVDRFWFISKETVKLPARLFDAEKRKEISGVVGSYETTRQTILASPGDVVIILAVISLSLAIINLFPFLPLDGGHIFWAIVEKVRRRPVPYSVMERAGVVGVALVLMLFFIGLSNDIDRLSGEGFKVR